MALVAVVAGVIGLMILPLPTVVLDALIAVNITVGLTLLLLTVYVPAPVDLSVFPSLLLITTVFRLSLSIAATRMILTEGQAGRIIDTFGAMAAGGNLVVGLVVFLIITIVQFVVIAKGAERVGEVTARFSLDSLPGKQLSIDSDLRSGLIEKQEARARRRTLDLESKLHGSLDGAMKFVKGDAIAGMVIVAVNLIGGLLIGVLQRGLSIDEAVHTYSLLTIGDGLVTQIPALLITMAAGLIVTRTTDETRDSDLAAAIGRQLTAQPRVPFMVGGLCCAVAWVPGFPSAVFMALGIAAIAAGVGLQPRLRQALARRFPGSATRWLAPADEDALEPIIRALVPPRPAPLRLEIAGGSADAGLREALRRMLGDLEVEQGLILPSISCEPPGDFAPGRWRLSAYDLVLGEGALDAAAPVDQVASAVRSALRRHLGRFMGIQEAAALMARISDTHSEVVKEVGRVRTLAKTAEVLRRLAEEEVSLQSLHLVLEALAGADPGEKDGANLAEIVRVELREHILQRYAPDGALRALLLTPATEALIRKGLIGAGSAQKAALPPTAAKALLLDVAAKSGLARALVVSLDLRRHVRRIIAPEAFDLAVLSFNELHPRVRLDLVGRVNVAEPDAAAA